MKLTFPKVGIAILVVFAFLIRDDLFFSHDDEHVEAGTEAHGSAGGDAGGTTAAVAEAPAHVEAAAPVTEMSAHAAPPAEAPVEAIAEEPATEEAATEEPATEEAVAEPAPALAVMPTPPPVAPAPIAIEADNGAEAQQWSVTEYWVAARTAFMIGDLRRAREEYMHILAAEPGNWFAHEELGNVYARNNQFDKAVQHYQQAALLLVQAARYEDAQKIALRMAQLYPNWKDRVPEGLAEH